MSPNVYRTDGWVKNVLGNAIPGAQIYFLSQPATVVPPITPPRTTPVPFTPSPLAEAWSDQGFTPISWPVLTDSYGHYDVYLLPGLYTLAVYFNGTLQNFYIDQGIGGIGSGGGTSLLLSTNGSPNFDQAALDLVQGSGITLFSQNTGDTIISATPSPRVAALSYICDGGGSPITVGAKGQLSIPTGCTITGWVITSDQPGSAVVDVLRSSYPNFPATVSIASTDKPTLTAAQKNENLAVSMWTTSIAAGDQIEFYVDSAATVTRLNISLNVTVP